MAVPARPEPTIAEVLALVGTKAGFDLRDRLAYMHLTGTFPTHLRPCSTSLLRAASRYARPDGAPDLPRMIVEPTVVTAYDLDRHPMVQAVNKRLDEGWSIQLARHLTDRRPFGRVLLERDGPSGPERLTVKGDGSWKEGWPP
jgi:hypothetical protein